MRDLRILGAVALVLAMLAADAAAQRRGGAVSSGMRGAVVGGMIGGSEGAATGAKVGAVTGATRAAINRETQARTQYAATSAYQSAPRSNFQEAPPDIFAKVAPATTTATAKKASGEAVIRKDGKPIVGITYPSDWIQKTGDFYVTAVSPDGQAYSMVVIDEAADKQEGVKKLKEGLEYQLADVKYDEPSERKGGSVVITGTGKGKKAGVDVVFAAGLFEAGKGQFAGAAFVVDAKIEDHYKETIRGICQTIRVEKDFAEQKREVAKPVSK